MPDTPAEWLKVLLEKLQGQRTDLERYEAYFGGDHPLPIATTKYRVEFNAMLREINDNWCPLIVDAVNERLHVQGFRLPDEPEGDKDAWDIWQRNYLDADSELGHETALVTGMASLLVWGDTDDRAVITVEHPSQVYVASEPGNRRKRLASIKHWKDEYGPTEWANVYLPEGIYKFVRNEPRTLRPGVWDQYDAVPNPLGVVPMVPLGNRPDLYGRYRSELREALSTQDQINKLVCDMIVASEFAAFRQRWATGVEVDEDENGNVREPWRVAVSRIITVPDPDARFGEFQASDLGNYVKAIENRVQSLASRTRTPPHYLLGQSGSFPSGESLKSTETGLIAKVRSRMRHFGEAWEEAIRLAFAVEGDARSVAYGTETIWADPESRTEGEHVDALLKLRTLKVPLRQLWEDAGYSQEQIDRFVFMLAEEALNESLGAPSAITFESGTAPTEEELANF